MDDLPRDVIYEILLREDFKSISHYCRVSRKAAKVCKEQLFWKDYIHSFSHHEYQELLIHLARVELDLYSLLLRLLKLEIKPIDYLTVYYMWLYAHSEVPVLGSEGYEDLLEDPHFRETRTNLRDWLFAKGKKIMSGYGPDQDWRYSFEADPESIIEFSEKLREWQKYTEDDFPIDVESLPLYYVGDYIVHNTNWASILKELLRTNLSLILDTVLLALADYFASNKDDNAISLALSKMESNDASYTRFISLLNHSKPLNAKATRKIINKYSDISFELAKNLLNVQIGAYPELYFELVQKVKNKNEQKIIHKNMLLQFIENGYTTTAEMIEEKLRN